MNIATTSTLGAEARTSSAPEALSFGPVHLDVVDRDRSLAWWRDVVGLHDVTDHADTLELGVGGEPLIVLRPTATSPVRRGYSGLYHLAINLPDEPAFAQLLARLMATGARHSTTDHVVAKSIYLADPDGIGLELTVELVDRVKSISWRETEQHPEIIDVDGRRREGLEPLDVEAVLAKLPAGELPRSLPTGTRVGHVHLKVPELAAAYAFYRDQLGLIPNNYVPVIGYGDLGTGDYRVHRVAVNTWTGVGLPPRPPQMAGMDQYTLRFESPARLDETVGRLEHVEARDGVYLARDTAGNTIALEASGRDSARGADAR